jgi:hypothetical protein
MSTYKAIAAVTKTLLHLIEHKKATDFKPFNFDATAYHLEYLTTKLGDEDHINVYLYNVKENQSLRNLDLPHRDRKSYNRVANPYLSLDLYYVLTAHSIQQFYAELMLGYAMLKLFENPIISKEYLSTYMTLLHGSESLQRVRC